MSAVRRICVATASRAEYSHLQWLVRDLRDHPAVDLSMVVASALLSAAHGSGVGEIEETGITIERVHSLLADDSPVAVAKSMALALAGFAEAFERLRPDLVVILGDRFEMLAAAAAAMLLRLPIAHLHGGETTEGVIDEAVRHAITKLAHLHFVAAQEYGRRVVQLGEAPACVFNFGAPGLDHLTRTTFLDREALERDLGLGLAAPLLLVTYHPVSLAERDRGAAELIAALDRFPSATVVLTGVNVDPDNLAIARVFQDFAAANPHRARLFSSLGVVRYLSLMRQADVVVGNSSSGLIEAPAVGVPTVNIGDRQRGRLRAPSVIDCLPEREAVAAAVDRALSPEWREIAARAVSPYGKGDASRRIAETLATVPLDGILFKHFVDLPDEGR